MTQIDRVGDFSLQWGESLRWDDRRERLYFVDCGTQTLHWLEHGEPPLHSLELPSLPTGLVLTDDERVIAALGDGLHVIDPDRRTTELLTAYPDDLGARANDAAADLDGNLVTGTLNLAPGPGSYWRYSATDGWGRLDEGIGNANGPVVLNIAGTQTLVFADTIGSVIYAYDYEGAIGKVGPRRTFADTSALNGAPDGSCADAQEGVWSCILGVGKLARYTSSGLAETIDTGVELPSDVTFGGPNLDRLYFVSIALQITEVEIKSPHAGALMAITDSGFNGRPEPRFRL